MGSLGSFEKIVQKEQKDGKSQDSTGPLCYDFCLNSNPSRGGNRFNAVYVPYPQGEES